MEAGGGGWVVVAGGVAVTCNSGSVCGFRR